MTSAVDLGASSGSITIRAALSEGLVRSVQVLSSRPSAMSRLFVGRKADEAPLLAGRLFSLCGYSHRVASRLAIDAAQGRAQEGLDGYDSGLLAERLGDYLRSLIMGWPDVGIGGQLTRQELGQAREALSLCRDLVSNPRATVDWGVRLQSLMQNFDIRDESDLGQRLLKAIPDAPVFSSGPADILSREDDDKVVGALMIEGEAFAKAPYLIGRCPETGAYARSPIREANPGAALMVRMLARLADLRSTIDQLTKADAVKDLYANGRSGVYEGYGAVESPRGRLYHWARLDSNGLVVDYGIVSPTEWNFHPAGPFVATLLGARVGGAEQALGLISWLAALFDPCVAFRVSLEESDHA
jgi:uptake hydrogenase large subunit